MDDVDLVDGVDKVDKAVGCGDPSSYVPKLPRTTFGWKMRILLGAFALDSWGAKVGKIISLASVLAFAVGAVFFFRSVFGRILEMEGIGEPLLWRVIGITLATVFILLIVSNLITGIASIFRSPSIAFLMSRPVPYQRIFMDKFIDNLVYSSWSLLVLGVPLVAAWGWAFHLPIYKVLFVIVLGLAPLVLASSIVAVAALLGLVLLAKATSGRFAMAVVLVVVVLTLGWAVSRRGQGLVVEGRARQSTVERYIAGLQREPSAPATPPQWMTATMRATLEGRNSRALFFAGLLTLTAAVWMRWLYVLAGRVYHRAWSAFGEISGRREERYPQRSARLFTRSLLPNPLGAMLRKDLLQFRRNPNQWAQFLILVSFLLVYLANLIWVSSRFDFNNPQWKVLVMFLNFSFTGFILATLSVRFVYPLISLEGQAFWVTKSKPVSMGVLFWEKFILAFVVFMALCEIIVLVSNRVLNVPPAMMALTSAATFLMGATLTGLAIGMGALLPDFKEESPMRIASTPGGVMTVLISLLYVGLMIAILAWPAQGYFRYLLGRGELPVERAFRALAAVLLLNGLTMIVPLRLGYRALKERDW